MQVSCCTSLTPDFVTIIKPKAAHLHAPNGGQRIADECLANVQDAESLGPGARLQLLGSEDRRPQAASRSGLEPLAPTAGHFVGSSSAAQAGPCSPSLPPVYPNPYATAGRTSVLPGSAATIQPSSASQSGAFQPVPGGPMSVKPINVQVTHPGNLDMLSRPRQGAKKAQVVGLLACHKHHAMGFARANLVIMQAAILLSFRLPDGKLHMSLSHWHSLWPRWCQSCLMQIWPLCVQWEIGRPSRSPVSSAQAMIAVETLRSLQSSKLAQTPAQNPGGFPSMEVGMLLFAYQKILLLTGH